MNVNFDCLLVYYVLTLWPGNTPAPQAPGQVNRGQVCGSKRFNDAVLGSLFDDAALGSLFDDAALGSLFDDAALRSLFDDAALRSLFDDAALRSECFHGLS